VRSTTGLFVRALSRGCGWLSKHRVRVDHEGQSFVHLGGDGRVNQNHQPVAATKIETTRRRNKWISGDVHRLPDGQDENGRAKFVDAWTGGIVYAPDKEWADEVISEVADFPYGEHDDWTDTASQALGWVRRTVSCAARRCGMIRNTSAPNSASRQACPTRSGEADGASLVRSDWPVRDLRLVSW